MNYSEHSLVISDEAFDRNSGSLIERVLFHNRGLVCFICLMLTVLPLTEN